MKSTNKGLSRFFDADGNIISNEALARQLRKHKLFIALYVMSVKNQDKLSASKANEKLARFWLMRIVKLADCYDLLR